MTRHPLADPDLDDFPTVGRAPSLWRDLRERLSDWLHPDSAFTRRFLPKDPTAREIALLVFLHGDRMRDEDLREILADIRRRLGIKPFKTRNLPYVGPEEPRCNEVASPSASGVRYLIQNRYQDEGWQDCGKQYHSRAEAFKEASRMSYDSICYGMVRVVDTATGNVVVTFGAGSNGEPLS